MAEPDQRLEFERRVAWFVAVAGGAFLIYLLAPVLTPFVAAALLAYLGDPLVDRLEKLKLPRTVAVGVVFLLTFLALALLIVMILPLVQTQIAALVGQLPKYAAWIETNVLPRLEGIIGPANDDIGLAAFLKQYGSLAGNWGQQVFSSVSRSGGVLLSGLVSLLLLPVITFYLLRDWDLLVARIGVLIPIGKRQTVFELAKESDRMLGGFLRGQVLVMLGLTLIYTVGLAVLGLDYALAIGVLAGLVSFVPYLGFIVGIGLAGLSALVEGGGWIALVGVVAVFGVGQMIEGMFLTPHLVGNRIGLHPVIVIFAVLAGGQLFGFFGILLALPAASVLSVLARFFHQRYFPQEHRELAGSGED